MCQAIMRLLAAATGAMILAWGQVPQAPPPRSPPFFKGGKEKRDPKMRDVQGMVQDVQSNPVEGAVVKLKNVKTLAVISFITKADGKYRFSSLNKDVEYELAAQHEGKASETKSVSVFDDRSVIVLNLKLEDKQEKSEEDKKSDDK